MAVVKSRVGLLGGTFDPIHFGHLLLAEEARLAVPLDRVLFVPAGQPPHKLRQPHTPIEHRLAMLELAIRDNPAFGISLVDVQRAGPHYSVDMVRLIQEQLGPDAELFFLMGMDSLANIGTWHEPARLLELCRLVVADRVTSPADRERLAGILPQVRERAIFISMPLIEISGADLRRRAAAGLSIRYQVPEAVRLYIAEHGLYRELAPSESSERG
jgi:nicotinate-nucleotide adenylyltransferase